MSSEYLGIDKFTSTRYRRYDINFILGDNDTLSEKSYRPRCLGLSHSRPYYSTDSPYYIRMARITVRTARMIVLIARTTVRTARMIVRTVRITVRIARTTVRTARTTVRATRITKRKRLTICARITLRLIRGKIH
jgi:hypothetical protein